MVTTSAPAARRLATSRVPLLAGDGRRRPDLGVHPRVDLVEDAEVDRRAHAGGAGPTAQAGRDWAARSSEERPDVGDDAEGLVAAPVGELGDDGLVDVDAQNVSTPAAAGCRWRWRAASVASIRPTATPGEVGAGHGVGGHHDVGDGVGQRPVVAHRTAQHERHAPLHALGT